MQLRGLPLVAVAIAAALIAANPSRVVALDEESIPSADLTATPTASPSPGAEGLSGAVATPVATSTPMMFPEPTPIAAATDEGSPEINGSAPAAQVSDLPLDSAIDAAQTDPARAASMRVAELARQELVAGHPDEAIRTLQRAMSIDSSDPYAYFYLGRAALAKKQFQQAMVFFKRAEIGFGQNPIWLGETLA